MDDEKSTRYVIKRFLQPGELPYEYEKQNIEFRKKIRSLLEEGFGVIMEHLKESKEKSKGESSE